jgi:hypothetical protein
VEKSGQSKLVSTRRSTVLGLPLQQGFPAGSLTCFTVHGVVVEAEVVADGVSKICSQVEMLLNLFPSSLTMRPKKLEGLPSETLSGRVLEFEGKARANPIRGPFRCFLLG